MQLYKHFRISLYKTFRCNFDFSAANIVETHYNPGSSYFYDPPNYPLNPTSPTKHQNYHCKTIYILHK